ncbi:ORF6C domain-containing protein [Paenibacillus sp. MSJ-6]|uniref:ORF6C domain-containing protein n=2 Tax=Paenibacillus brevis TaxID=2841508 RepID=A0ABS6FR04_9BACL|nr:ORF6C domain-containing protein [Paenibacillus brevis]
MYFHLNSIVKRREKKMNNLQIINQNGQLLVDSREVAAMIEVRHSDLLERIGGYIRYLENGKFRSQDFFISSTYKVDGNNKTYDCYLITRKGCDMVANKMTGEKGVLFTAAYVTQFEEMEKSLSLSGMSKELQAIFMLDQRTQAFESRVSHLENNTTIDYGQQNDLQLLANKTIVEVLGGKGSPAYLDKTIRGEAYSALWRDFKGYFNTNSYRNTLVKDFDKAKEYVSGWRPHGKLLRDIEQANSQMAFS